MCIAPDWTIKVLQTDSIGASYPRAVQLQHTMIPVDDGREILQFVNVDGRIQYAECKLPEKLPKYPWPFGSGIESPLPDAGRSRF